MAEQISLFKKVSGSNEEIEDWFSLVIDDDGSKSILHSWDHADGYGRGHISDGSILIPLDELDSSKIRPRYIADLKKKLAELES